MCVLLEYFFSSLPHFVNFYNILYSYKGNWASKGNRFHKLLQIVESTN